MPFSRPSESTLTAIAVAGLPCAAAYRLLFGAALRQGEDNWQVHAAILRLGFHRLEAIPLAGDRLLIANKPN